MLYPQRVAKMTLIIVTITETISEFFIYVPKGIDCHTLKKLVMDILEGRSDGGETITSSAGLIAVTIIQ